MTSNVSLTNSSEKVHLTHEGVFPAILRDALRLFSRGDVDGVRALLSDQGLDRIRIAADQHPKGQEWVWVTSDLLVQIQEIPRSIEWFQEYNNRRPCAMGWNHLFYWLRIVGRLEESLDCACKALEMEPQSSFYWGQCAEAYYVLGEIKRGTDLLGQACQRFPEESQIFSKYLAMSHYLKCHARGTFFKDYCRLGRLIEQPYPVVPQHQNLPDPDRRLRVGILTPYFRNNSVGFTIGPLLDGMSPDAVEWFGYSLLNPCEEDELTERVKKHFAVFRPVEELSTDALSQQIRQDRIDILLEVAGYVGGHRMDVMASKPAPIQVDLGAIDTTGLTRIDYRLTDHWVDPKELPLPYTETSVYLPHGCQCYRPWLCSPVRSSPPLVDRGYPTLGGFHDFYKISEQTLQLWGAVMAALPSARLLIKFRWALNKTVQQRLLKRCGEAGCDIARIDFIGWDPHGDHLSLLNEVDLMLDTLPYSGAVMTLEALWMGVPTVTLAGEPYVSRLGVTPLERVGLGVFVAKHPKEYVDKVVSFVQQPQALGELRRGLRQRFLESSICDAKQYADEVAQAFRYMWYRWCRSQGVEVNHSEPAGWFRESEGYGRGDGNWEEGV